MRIVRSGDPEIWEARSSGHVGLFLFGLPFFLAGLFVMSTPLGLVPAEGEPAPWYLVVPLGSVFALVGLGLMTGRTGIIIDRRRHRIIKWYGLLFPMKRTEYLLDFYARLILGREVRRGNKSSRIVYPVRLESNGHKEALDLEEPQDYQQARTTAESLSEFLKLPLVDRSSGKEMVREPDRLDESIRERARRTREEIPEAVPPPQMKSTLREEAGTLYVHIPPTGLTPMHRLELVGLLVFVAVAMFFVRPLSYLDTQDPMRYAFLGLILVGFLFLPLAAGLSSVIGQARRPCTVQASRGLLRVGIGKKVTEILADELEELEIPDPTLPSGIVKAPDGRFLIDRQSLKRGTADHRWMGTDPGPMVNAGPVVSAFLSMSLKTMGGPVIIARSDKATVRFGQGLSREELSYLHGKLKRMLAA